MADDFGWEREWSRTTIELVETDAVGTSSVSGDECPRCAAIVRTLNRAKHEAVCWGPDAVNVAVYKQSAAMDGEDIRYRLQAVAQVGDYAREFEVECTREFLTDSPDALRFLMFRLDHQIMEARKNFG